MIKEINLNFLIKIFKNFWWKILIFAVLVAIVVGAFSHFTYVPTYSSNVKFYVLNLSMTSEYTTQSLISAAQSLSNDYIEIIMGDDMTKYLAGRLEELGHGKISPDAIRGMLSATTDSTASTFTVYVTSTNPDLAEAVATLISEESADIVKNTTKPYLKLNYYVRSEQPVGTDNEGNKIYSYKKIEALDYDCYTTLRAPRAAAQNSANVATSAFIAGAVAAIVAYAFFMFRRLLETVIRSADNVKEIVSIPIIGTIPTWENTTSSKYSQEESKK